MPKNAELDLALQFIEKTDRNLFITGKAGTGKTTFLHNVKAASLKRMVVVAPTGVAAINAKGSYLMIKISKLQQFHSSTYTNVKHFGVVR